jgi:hypothetical protein
VTGVQTCALPIYIRELENLDRIAPDLGGDLYLINGAMTKLEDAGVFAGTQYKKEDSA